MKKIMVLCLALLMIVPGVSATFGGPDFCEIHPDLCDFDICEFIPELCGPVCGNGVLTHPEECDDGNLDNGDGCSELCTIEPFPDDPHDVPEFTTVGALAALGGAGYFMYRRKK